MTKHSIMRAVIAATTMLWAVTAQAQSLIAPGHVIGNGNTAPHTATDAPLSSVIDQYCNTNGDVLFRGASLWGCGTPPSGVYGTVSANKVLAGPTTGSAVAPGFRALVGADFPANVVPLSSIAQLGASSLFGNPTGSTANMGAITLGSTLNFSGTTLNCTAATTSQLGCAEPDGTTIQISGGKFTAVGASASSIDASGATSISNGVTNQLLYDNAGSVGHETVASILTPRAKVNTTTGGTFIPSTQSVFTMGGYAFSITPQVTGTIHVTIYGTIGIAVGGGAVGVGLAWHINYGTGTAPSQNATTTGTTCTLNQTYTNAVPVTAVNVFIPFSESCEISGLTPGTAYWVDLAGEQLSSTLDGEIFNAGFSAVEY